MISFKKLCPTCSLAATGFAFMLSATANATVYNFDVIYSGGGNAVLAAGSDNMLGVGPVNGDTINYSITASGGNYWTTIAPGTSVFIWGAIGDLFVSNGMAVGGFNYKFSFNFGAVSQFSGSGSGNQSTADLGPRMINFQSGMKFNNFSEFITLTSIAGPLQFGSLLPSWPGQAPEIGSPQDQYFTYTAAAPGPTPGEGLLSVALIVLMGSAARFRGLMD